jgi:hypothetical protein
MGGQIGLVEGVVCGICGKRFAGAHGLNVHKARKHGNTPPRAAVPHRPDEQMAEAPAAAAPADPSVEGICARMAADVDRMTQLLSDCVDGLEVLDQAFTRLRRAYIEKADKLQKLQAQIATVDDEAKAK